MISYIKGEVIKTVLGKDTYVDILTSCGIGYRVYIPSSYSISEKEVSLYTYQHIREDAQTLYGFKCEEDKNIFEKLIGVSGIGPKIALTVISTYSLTELDKIINEGDAKTLSKVSGLGLKGAQKIILDLRGKVDLKQKEEEKVIIRELRDALKALGFNGELLKEKLDSGEKILQKKGDVEIEELIKIVLSE